MWQTCRSSLFAQCLSGIPFFFFWVASTSSAIRVFNSSKRPGSTAHSSTQYTFSLIDFDCCFLAPVTLPQNLLFVCTPNDVSAAFLGNPSASVARVRSGDHSLPFHALIASC